jgi:predicted permease
MPLWRRLRYGLRVLANRHAADRDLDDEARQFLEELARSFEAQGMPPDEALRAARMETGSIPGIREQVRDAGWERWVTGAMDDFRYAARRIRRSPGFTCSAILTLALGIGATSAIFAVIDRVLLKPLPYSHADRLVALTHTAPGINLKYLRMSPSLYFTYREESRVLDNIALWNGNRSTVTGLGMPEEVPTLFVTTEFFDVLGVHPAIGRGFNTPDGDWNGERTAILSNAYWKQRFGAAASALGRRILVDGNAHEIVGVLPPSFEFLDEKISLVIPRPFRREELRLIQFTEDGIARLKPGVTLEQARSDLARCLLLAPRKFPLNSGFASNTFEQARISPTPRPLKDHQVGDVGETLWVLLGGVALLLLIACANVANLLLVRADARQHELAIRNALGAGWRRIARDIFTESLILGILAGAFGISICYATLRWAAHAGIGNLPRFTGISLDWRTLGFTLVISIGSAFVFGLLPVWKYAIRAADCDLGSGGGRSATHGRKQNTALRSVLVLQVALAMVLLAGSGLMLRTFQAMRSVQPGFANPAEVQIVRVSIPPARIADPEHVLRTEEAILRKFSEIPGVSGVAIATSAPMQGGNHDPVYSTDHDLGQGKIPPVRNMRSVSPGFVAVLESRLVAGRDFTWHEIYRGDSIALVSRKMAREL